LIIRKKRYFIPKEAGPIADSYEAQANKVDDLARRILQVEKRLKSNWMGNSADMIIPLLPPEYGHLTELSDMLRNKSKKIRTTTCYEWVTVEVPDK
jgi:hypothetical protein